MGPMIINIIVMILFLIFAAILSKGKGAALIAGYNTLPAEKKAEYDELALCKFMGRIMYGISFCLFLWVLSEALGGFDPLFYLGLAILTGLIVFAITYTNTGKRFKKKE